MGFDQHNPNEELQNYKSDMNRRTLYMQRITTKNELN